MKLLYKQIYLDVNEYLKQRIKEKSLIVYNLLFILVINLL